MYHSSNYKHLHHTKPLKNSDFPVLVCTANSDIIEQSGVVRTRGMDSVYPLRVRIAGALTDVKRDLIQSQKRPTI
jgi:hypothetical protein